MFVFSNRADGGAVSRTVVGSPTHDRLVGPTTLDRSFGFLPYDLTVIQLYVASWSYASYEPNPLLASSPAQIAADCMRFTFFCEE